jgi:YidC/Oxa1 family membrane protein insertase
MDRNTIYGIILIAGIFIIWGVFNKPNKEEIERRQQRRDSLELVQKKIEPVQQVQTGENTQKVQNLQVGDSLNVVHKTQELGAFTSATSGENRIFTLENDLISFKISEKGGRPFSVGLKKYKTYNSLPVLLFDGDSSLFGMNFYSQNRHVNTNDLYFKSSSDVNSIKVTNTPATISMRLNSGEGKYIEYRYTLAPGKYQVDMEIEFTGMNDISTQRAGIIDLDWMIYAPQQEKGRDNELQYTTLYYKPYQDDVDYLNARTKKQMQSENLSTQVEWIAYKDQFFSSVIMADKAFVDAVMEMEMQPSTSKYLKRFKSSIGLPFEGSQKQVVSMHFYFGPNKYKLLKKQYGERQLQDLVTVGRGIIKWINQIVIIKLFDFLSKFITNYGIIILIMTIIIKIFLLPLTFKSYLSTAKMKVLKPQIDEINSKIPKEKAMERQQATMALYKKAGVSPLGGCLPMLLQMPILFAMFRFFPTSIELRQQGFLWATDLSTYDSIYEWSAYIPFLSSFYGNHISLFTILMTVSTILTMKFNNQTAATNQQMPGMQTMMYIMPVMFMFILNKFSAGLTYYYFLANVLTFGQNMLFARFIDEDELLAKLESKKAKPVKKSNFQKRLETMAKQQGYKSSKKR